MKNKSIKELREICQPEYEDAKKNPYYRIYRRFFRTFSIYITSLLIKINFSANMASCLGLIFGLTASVNFYFGNFIFGAILLQLWFLMDTLDGELARYYNFNKKNNNLVKGEYLDLNFHHLVHSLVFLSLGLGLFNLNHDVKFIYLGVSSLYALFLNELIDLNKIKVLFSFKSKNVKTKIKKSLIQKLMVIYTFPTIANLILLFSIFNSVSFLVYFYGITFPILVITKFIVNSLRKW